MSVTSTALSYQSSIPNGVSGLVFAVVAGGWASSLNSTDLKPSALPAPSIERYSSVCAPSTSSANGPP